MTRLRLAALAGIVVAQWWQVRQMRRHLAVSWQDCHRSELSRCGVCDECQAARTLAS